MGSTVSHVTARTATTRTKRALLAAGLDRRVRSEGGHGLPHDRRPAVSYVFGDVTPELVAALGAAEGATTVNTGYADAGFVTVIYPAVAR
jgi:hypothetical protein